MKAICNFFKIHISPLTFCCLDFIFLISVNRGYRYLDARYSPSNGCPFEVMQYPLCHEGRRDRDRMVVGFTTTFAISVSSNPAHGRVYLIQHYVIKFVSDLRGFLRILRFPPPIYLTEILLKVLLNTIYQI